jgi:hypothetical protein
MLADLRSLRPSLVCIAAALAVSCVTACGGGSGGEESKDAGHPDAATTADSKAPGDGAAGGDSTLPQESGVDATIDTGAIAETGGVDSGAADSEPVDTGIVDTGTLDTGTLDTGTVEDTGAPDAFMPPILDTGTAPDTSVTDTGAADTAVADTNPADALAADSAPIDSAVADATEAGPGDAAGADSTVSDGASADAATDATDATVPQEAGGYTIGGTVTGLAGGDSFQIEDNGTDAIFVSQDGRFTFPTALASGAMYVVKVVANPQTPAAETCVVTNGTGTVGSSNVTDISINCTINGYTLGGTVYGLAAGTQLVLEDGTSSTAVVNGNGSASQTFQMSALVTPSGSYDVTVPTQPTGQLCYIPNPTGTASNNVSSIIVKCRTGLVAYYPFDEGSGTTMLDVTGNGNNGLHDATYVAGATPTTGTALAFNGSQGGTVNGNAAFTWGANNADYTVDYWLLTNVVQTDGNWTTIFHKSDPSGGNCCSDWQRSPAQWFYPNSLIMHCPMATATNGNNAAVPCSSTPIAIQTWTHFATVHDSSMTAEVVYINGVLANTIALGDTTVGGTGILFLATGPGGYDNLNGNLDEVRIYNRVLSQAEVQADMQ